MKLSLCIICKNEEGKIQRCIESVKSLIDEIIVVDTGSTDQTVELAKQEGAIIYHMQWENDFSKARNYALSKASGKWIIFLDADEYLDEKSLKYIKSAVISAQNKKLDVLLANFINLGEEEVTDAFKLIRIFRRSERMIYRNTIHEKLVHLDRELKALDCSDYINIFHDGYMKNTVEDKNKVDRNKEMLLCELDKNPDSSDLHYYLSYTYDIIAETEKVFYHATEAVKYNNFTLPAAKLRIYNRILSVCLQQNKQRNIVENWYQKAIEVHNEFPDYDWYYSSWLFNNNDMINSIKYLESCKEKIEKYEGITSSDITIKIDKIYYILAQRYIQVGLINQALILLVKLIKVDKHDYRALCELIKVLEDKESVGNIVGFLSKIYDDKMKEDRMILAKVAKQANHLQLADYYYNNLTAEEKEHY